MKWAQLDTEVAKIISKKRSGFYLLCMKYKHKLKEILTPVLITMCQADVVYFLNFIFFKVFFTKDQNFRSNTK